MTAAMPDASLLAWLSSPDNPPVRYLTARDLIDPPPSDARLRELRADILQWDPLGEILALQQENGGFLGGEQSNPTARPTFWALCLMQRCGLDITDEPVLRAVTYLDEHHMRAGALSYTTGASGVLPCYLGVATTALIKMGALDTDLVQGSIRWLVEHQRFDHRATRAGGDRPWPYKAPQNFGCWETVSCFHGVAGAFRAFAAVPPGRRSSQERGRLDEAIEYLSVHRLYRKSRSGRLLFRHMTESFLVGDYRSDLLDMLQGIADADPALAHRPWVRAAVADMEELATGGRVDLVKNYGHKLMEPIPLEPVGGPSRFLTYQWQRIRSVLHPQLT